MKNLEWIGENNLGFLVFRGEAGKSEENIRIVQAENEDRRTVYGEIAVKVNTTSKRSANAGPCRSPFSPPSATGCRMRPATGIKKNSRRL